MHVAQEGVAAWKCRVEAYAGDSVPLCRGVVIIAADLAENPASAKTRGDCSCVDRGGTDEGVCSVDAIVFCRCV